MSTNSLKITIFTTSYPRFRGDGTAPFIQSIAQGLKRRGHEVEVVAPYDILVDFEHNYDDILVHRFRYAPKKEWHIMGHARATEADVKLKFLAYLLLPLFFCYAFYTLFRVARQQKSDIIYAHWALPGGLVAACVSMITGIPFILSLHGSDVYVAKKNPLFGLTARFVFKKAAFVSACSPELRAKAMSLGASPKSFVLPYGVDVNFFTTRTDLSARPLSIVSVGRLVYKKGFEKLITAFQSVVKQYPQAHLTIAGGGPLLENLSDLVISLGLESVVSLVGNISWEQIPDFLHSADIFALPSIHDAFGNVDGLPNVLLEAMSCGLPIVASNVGGVGLVISHEENGLLIPEGDVEELALTLLRLSGDRLLRDHLGSRAREWVVSNATWDHFCRRIEYLAAGVVATKGFDLRMGTVYRNGLIEQIQDRFNGSVLDVGCHDGYFLSGLSNEFKVGIDPFPVKKSTYIPFPIMQADGVALPFSDHTFDIVYALDVIEHVEQDRLFVHSLCRVLKPGGEILMTTPSLQIEMFPFFLTQWISLKWGHDLRIGYTQSQIHDLFPEDIEVNIFTWNAPFWRYLYLPLRLLHVILPNVTTYILKQIVTWDANFKQGVKGYLIIKGKRKNDKR